MPGKSQKPPEEMTDDELLQVIRDGIDFIATPQQLPSKVEIMAYRLSRFIDELDKRLKQKSSKIEVLETEDEKFRVLIAELVAERAKFYAKQDRPDTPRGRP